MTDAAKRLAQTQALRKELQTEFLELANAILADEQLSQTAALEPEATTCREMMARLQELEATSGPVLSKEAAAKTVSDLKNDLNTATQAVSRTVRLRRLKRIELPQAEWELGAKLLEAAWCSDEAKPTRAEIASIDQQLAHLDEAPTHRGADKRSQASGWKEPLKDLAVNSQTALKKKAWGRKRRSLTRKLGTIARTDDALREQQGQADPQHAPAWADAFSNCSRVVAEISTLEQDAMTAPPTRIPRKAYVVSAAAVTVALMFVFLSVSWWRSGDTTDGTLADNHSTAQTDPNGELLENDPAVVSYSPVQAPDDSSRTEASISQESDIPEGKVRSSVERAESNSTANTAPGFPGNSRESVGPSLGVLEESVGEFLHEQFDLSSTNTEIGSDPKHGLRNSRYYLASYHDERSIRYFKAYISSYPQGDISVYLDLAICYLSVGQFDSATKALKAAEQQFPDDNEKFVEHIATLQKHALNVKATLTAARDLLRKEGHDIVYPSEKIFFRALDIAATQDDYLRLNIVDAYDSAHPDSDQATRYVIDANFTLLESEKEQTSVPTVRGVAALERAMGAAQSFDDDSNRIYAAIRLTQFLISRLDRETGFFARSDINSLIRETLQLEATDDARAFLLYGDTLRSLKTGWERFAYIDELIKDMTEAVRLNENETAYRKLLQYLKSNRSRIDRQAIASREKANSAAVDAFLGRNKSMSTVEARRKKTHAIATAAVIGFIGLAIVSQGSEPTRQNPSLGGYTPKPCPRCNGSGVNPFMNHYGNSLCTECWGNGKSGN